jgi:hypothetical protein
MQQGRAAPGAPARACPQFNRMDRAARWLATAAQRSPQVMHSTIGDSSLPLRQLEPSLQARSLFGVIRFRVVPDTAARLLRVRRLIVAGRP